MLRHKWYVFTEGLKLKVPLWQLFIHDWTKFLPSEWLPYARTFRKPNGEGQYRPSVEFWRAWNSHEKRHKHHWQYWVLIKDTGDLEPLEVPDRYRREMLADWRGAGKALGNPNTWEWYEKNRFNMLLHPATRRWLEGQLSEQFLAYLIGPNDLSDDSVCYQELVRRVERWLGYLVGKSFEEGYTSVSDKEYEDYYLKGWRERYTGPLEKLFNRLYGI